MVIRLMASTTNAIDSMLASKSYRKKFFIVKLYLNGYRKIRVKVKPGRMRTLMGHRVNLLDEIYADLNKSGKENNIKEKLQKLLLYYIIGQGNLVLELSCLCRQGYVCSCCILLTGFILYVMRDFDR